MNRPGILNVEPADYSKEARRILQSIGRLDERVVSRNELKRILPDYEVLITRLSHRIDNEIIQAGSRLRVIASPTTGLDHIDTTYAEQLGIHLINLRGETSFLETITSTAEHTWTLILSLIRNLPSAVADVQNGRWRRDPFRGVELRGKCLGIVGYGRLGKIVARYGLVFGMEVVVYDPVEIILERGVRLVDFKTLLQKADVITLHLPLSTKTENLFDEQSFSLMKSGTYFINTSRGAIVNEQALLKFLRNNHLAGAAVDVIKGETTIQDGLIVSPLINYSRKHQNLIITPHIGGATWDSMRKTEIFVAEKLKAFIGTIIYDER